MSDGCAERHQLLLKYTSTRSGKVAIAGMTATRTAREGSKVAMVETVVRLEWPVPTFRNDQRCGGIMYPRVSRVDPPGSFTLEPCPSPVFVHMFSFILCSGFLLRSPSFSSFRYVTLPSLALPCLSLFCLVFCSLEAAQVVQ